MTNSTLAIQVDRTGNVSGLRALLAAMDGDARVRGILVLACDANGWTPDQIDPLLQSTAKPLFGGLFPQIIHGSETLAKGTLVIGLPVAPRLLTVPGLSDEQADFDAILDDHAQELGNGGTMFVWVDGLASRINGLVESIFHIFGLTYNYLGGGAGSLSFEQKPCLFTNQGMIGDSAVLALLDIPSGVGVSHGWTPISGPHKVTRARGNVIHSLNWRPAFDVYREAVVQATGQEVNRENFFAISKSHPFGIIRLGDEMIVRDPIVVQDDGSLVCVGEVPQESHVDILVGDANSLVAAARRARELAENAFDEKPSMPITFFVDCISRVLFLEEDFGRELAAVESPDRPLLGALTLGEIANAGRSYLEFYNKTAVVGILSGFREAE